MGRYLAWDGFTAEGLQATLTNWRRAGATPPTVLDLASESAAARTGP